LRCFFASLADILSGSDIPDWGDLPPLFLEAVDGILAALAG